MMAILKRGIDALRAASTPARFVDDLARNRDHGDPAPESDDRDRARRCEGMFYWGMAGGPWY